MHNPMEQFQVKPLIPLQLGGVDISFTNQALVMVVVVAAVSLFMMYAVSNRRLVPGRMQSMAELSYELVGNMIQSSAGPAGFKFFPLIFTLFFFVLFCNFFGMIPGVFTVTSQIAVTLGLALLVISVVILTGFMRNGIGFLKLFVPNAPLPLLFLVVPIEIISFLTRPVSLSVRLFANMLAGHTMLKVFAGFVIALGSAGGIFSALAIAPLMMIVAVTLLEFLVAFLQAYVFAILTCIYLSDALNLHDNHH